MYGSGTANGVPMSTLIDTGATVTHFQRRFFDILNCDRKVALTGKRSQHSISYWHSSQYLWKSSHQIQVWEENHIPDGIGVGHQCRCDSRARLSAK